MVSVDLEYGGRGQKHVYFASHIRCWVTTTATERAQKLLRSHLYRHKTIFFYLPCRLVDISGCQGAEARLSTKLPMIPQPNSLHQKYATIVTL